jgi:MFS family permease
VPPLLVTAITSPSASILSPIIMVFIMDQLGVEIAVLAVVYIPSSRIGALLPAQLGTLADRLGRRFLMVVGMTVAAGTSSLVPGLSSLPALAALWALQTPCCVAVDPAERALVTDLTRGAQRCRSHRLCPDRRTWCDRRTPMGGWLCASLGPPGALQHQQVDSALCAAVLWALLQVPAPDPVQTLS